MQEEHSVRLTYMKKPFLLDLSLEGSNNEDENNETDQKVDAGRTFSVTDMDQKNLFYLIYL